MSLTVSAPERGDIVWINFSPQEGHEQAGRRPALVLSPQVYNSNSGLFLVCPITNQSKGYPFEVTIPPGLGVTGVLLTDQVKSFDWNARRAELFCTLPDTIVLDVLKKINLLLHP